MKMAMGYTAYKPTPIIEKLIFLLTIIFSVRILNPFFHSHTRWCICGLVCLRRPGWKSKVILQKEWSIIILKRCFNIFFRSPSKKYTCKMGWIQMPIIKWENFSKTLINLNKRAISWLLERILSTVLVYQGINTSIYWILLFMAKKDCFIFEIPAESKISEVSTKTYHKKFSISFTRGSSWVWLLATLSLMKNSLSNKLDRSWW